MNREYRICEGADVAAEGSDTDAFVCEPDAESGRTRLAAGQDPIKRQQILEGAQNVFLRMGFDAASMNDITREAGVSKGTIYVYFNSKEDLFVALCEHYRMTTFSKMVAKIDKGFSTREELADFGVTLVTLITSTTAIRERGPKRSHLIMADFLSRMIEAGELEPFDPLEKAYQLTDLFLSGLYRPRLFGVLSEPPSEQTIIKNVENALDFFFRAYGSKCRNVSKQNIPPES
jgi:AcrR family transcriptional regulator